MKKKQIKLPVYKKFTIALSIALLGASVAYTLAYRTHATHHAPELVKNFVCSTCGQINVFNSPAAFKPDPNVDHSSNFKPNIVSITRGMYRPVIKTPRLLLREVSMNDLDILHSYFSDLTTTQSTTFEPHATREETRQEIKRILKAYKNNEIAHWAITKNDTGQVIGLGGIVGHNPANHHARIGWWIDHHYWNNGYATELGHALIEYGMKYMNLNRIDAEVRIDNIASRRVLEKIGMNHALTMRDYRLVRGEFLDGFIYVVLRKNIERQLQKSTI